MSKPRFILNAETHQPVIYDQEHDLNFLFVAGGGFGVDATALKLAARVVNFLNSLPPEETIPYPYNLKTK